MVRRDDRKDGRPCKIHLADRNKVNQAQYLEHNLLGPVATNKYYP